MVMEFSGRDQFGECLEALQKADAEGGTLSPGGASMLLGVSRQRVLALVETHDDIRAWLYYERWGKQAHLYEISVPDLIRWAVRAGQFRSEEDLGLQWKHLREMVRKTIAECNGAVVA